MAGARGQPSVSIRKAALGAKGLAIRP